MVKDNMLFNELEYFIINSTAYDIEPFHLIIGSILEQKICHEPSAIVDSIIELFKKGYLQAYYCKNKEYQKLKSLIKKELLNYLKEHAKHNFTEFPEEEYYFESTPSSHKFLEEKDRPVIKE